MNTLISLLILVIVFGLLFLVVQKLPLPEPWNTAAQVIVVLIALVLLLGWLVGGVNFPGLHLR